MAGATEAVTDSTAPRATTAAATDVRMDGSPWYDVRVGDRPPSAASLTGGRRRHVVEEIFSISAVVEIAGVRGR